MITPLVSLWILITSLVSLRILITSLVSLRILITPLVSLWILITPLVSSNSSYCTLNIGTDDYEKLNSFNTALYSLNGGIVLSAL
jgi:hypothetical protein